MSQTNRSSETRSIRSLKQKAKKGNIYSALQLKDYYESGKFVEKNLSEAENYKKLAYDFFKEQKVELSRLDLVNFRAFELASFENLDSNLNIFIGNNGSGKTTILDAIHLSLSWLSISINKNGGNGDQVEKDDINIYNKAHYSSVSSTISLNNNIKASIELNQIKDGYSKIRSKYNEIKTIGDLYKISNEFDEGFNMPLLAYYNVMRSYDVNPKDLKESYDISDFSSYDKFDAYQRSLTGKTDFNSFFRWYKKITDIQLKRTKVPVSVLKILVDKMSNELGFDIQDGSTEQVEMLKMLASKFEDRVESDSLASNKDITKHVDIINKVISVFMDGYSNLEIQYEPYLDLVVSKNGRKISVLRLSQGEKTLLALVLDIAKRLILLNPTLSDPLSGNGIILIDEFDLHLHPLWQKTVARNLITVFPNCQFFLTTHSSLVLTEVGHKHIFILNEDREGKIDISRPNQSYGLDSSQVLDELMSSDSHKQISRSSYVQQKLDLISDLIDEESKESLTLARSEIALLESEINGDIPELVKEKIRLETALSWLDDD
ncbi:AAA family ATPase [Vibrio parahaemolyticus]|nr:AAA family ATPase [Vibrio parahaemolyticus]EGQ9711929.1 AAA family ATPase [Vibrio parahaemolyticus]EIA0903186.1 AAA family ATPase [Vibrio parahaemolyticus]EIK4815445.1 AAA family ATPase [Vibrio parahaemolyticus]EJG1176534.1 AAA family ATPase [Vibrio parahaemolyticus]